MMTPHQTKLGADRRTPWELAAPVFKAIESGKGDMTMKLASIAAVAFAVRILEAIETMDSNISRIDDGIANLVDATKYTGR